jgi:hypothetical protein
VLAVAIVSSLAGSACERRNLAKLDEAWDEAVAKGWTIVSMKNDWSRIYP